jgi:hypothetical protein
MDFDVCLSATDGNPSILETIADGAIVVASLVRMKLSRRESGQQRFPVFSSSSHLVRTGHDKQSNRCPTYCLRSRTRACGSGNIPLEGRGSSRMGYIGKLIPMQWPVLGVFAAYRCCRREMTIREPKDGKSPASAPAGKVGRLWRASATDGTMHPPNGSDNVTYVTYLSPVALSFVAGRYVEEH